MGLIESNMFDLGASAPDFELPDTRSGQNIALRSEEKSAGTVIVFMCNHCPYVKHIVQGLVQLANDYRPKGIRNIAISSNDAVSHPEDDPKRMAEFAQKHHFNFPYLYDETQQVARDYRAACTPDFYLFDSRLECVYRGQMDGARPNNSVPNDGSDLRSAIDSLLSGQAINPNQKPSVGCSIKWK